MGEKRQDAASASVAGQSCEPCPESWIV